MTKPVERIVITVDNATFSDSTLEYAVTMAAQLKRPLHGIFIEDTDLLSSAALPFTTEICMNTGQPRNFNQNSLQSAFSEIAMRFQQQLAQRADKLAVQWSVSSIRGRRRDFHFEDLTKTDYCIYEASNAIQKSVSIDPKLKRILVIDGSGKAFYQTLATLLAPLKGNQLYITVVQDSEQAFPVTFNTLLPSGTKIDRLHAKDLTATLQHNSNQFDYVVVSRRTLLKELAPLLAQLTCPLIVVG